MEKAINPTAFFEGLMNETLGGMKKGKLKLLSIRFNGVFKADQYLNTTFNARKFQKADMPLTIKKKKKTKGEKLLKYEINLVKPKINLFELEIHPSFYQLLLRFVRYDKDHKKNPNAVLFGYSLLWIGDLTSFIHFVFLTDPLTLSQFIKVIHSKVEEIKALKLELIYVDATNKASQDKLENYVE